MEVWAHCGLTALPTQEPGESDNEAAESLRRQAAGMSEVTMHDLRHIFASALIRSGLNPKVVAERLGHANAAMTLNVYAHLWPDDEDRSRQAVDEALGTSSTDVPTVRPNGQRGGVCPGQRPK
jgi:hypothetical protein